MSDQFVRLQSIVEKLRAPDGCPWDRKQTPLSLRKHLLEETYEAIEAISEGDSAHVREELGDVLMLIALVVRMYTEEDSFTMSDVLSEVNEKLIRRHPHVFGDVKLEQASDVVAQWDKIKRDQEGKGNGRSALSGVSDGVPSLERSNELQKRAAKVGFDWPEIEGVFEKISEELSEVRAEMNDSTRASDADHPSSDSRDVEQQSLALESEVGDVLFSVVNLSRFLRIDPSVALHRANEKFKSRFEKMETLVEERGERMVEMDVSRLDHFWEEAKRNTP